MQGQEQIGVDTFFFHDGVNNVDSCHRLSDSTLRYLDNCYLSNGSIYRRLPYDADVFTNALTYEVMDVYYATSLGKYIAATKNGTSVVYYRADSPTGSWTEIDTLTGINTDGVKRSFFGVLNARLVYTPYDTGENLYTSNLSTAGAEVTDSADSRGFEIHKDCVFAFAAGNSDRLEWSDSLDPTNGYEADGALWIDVGRHQGRQLYGACSFYGERLILFKDVGVYELLGSSTDDFYLRQVSDSIGTINSHAITMARIQGRPVCIFMTTEGRVMAYDGQTFSDLTGKVSTGADSGDNTSTRLVYYSGAEKLYVVPDTATGGIIPATTAPYTESDDIKMNVLDLKTMTWSRSWSSNSAVRGTGRQVPTSMCTGINEAINLGVDSLGIEGIIAQYPGTTSAIKDICILREPDTSGRDFTQKNDEDRDGGNRAYTSSFGTKEYYFGDPAAEKQIYNLVIYGDLDATSLAGTLDIWLDGTEVAAHTSFTAGNGPSNPWVIPIQRTCKSFAFEFTWSGDYGHVDGWQIESRLVGRRGF